MITPAPSPYDVYNFMKCNVEQACEHGGSGDYTRKRRQFALPTRIADHVLVELL